MENGTGYQVTSQMVRSVHEVARYTKIHVKYNVLISGKLRYPATLWSGGCQISQILLYVENQYFKIRLVHTLLTVLLRICLQM
jgi:hypothetical protein